MYQSKSSLRLISLGFHESVQQGERRSAGSQATLAKSACAVALLNLEAAFLAMKKR